MELVRHLCSKYILRGGEYPLSCNSLILMLEMYRTVYSFYVVKKQMVLYLEVNLKLNCKCIMTYSVVMAVLVSTGVESN